jgi:MazG family protein
MGATADDPTRPGPAPAGDGTAAALMRLDRITRRLRRECPWDRQQDERSIVPHTVEEAYELADAAARGDDEKLLDELGDVLFQVYFLSLLLEERRRGSLGEVAEAMTAKLIRRHPHVFGEAEAETAGEVLRNWDRIKREVEGRGAGEPFADVPENLPGPLFARKVLRRAASAELEGPAVDVPAAMDRARSELASLTAAAGTGEGEAGTAPARDAIEHALGELLLAIVDAARLLRVDPELQLRAAAGRLREEATASSRGGTADSGR